ncbi:MAG TPA: NAD(P)-dependent oxidoreductase [Thermoanaerobaculaceae bacterium]|nr:NAD(P)-dependent oxidoreductase [Thermoanaerobaculaceae bacterium]
MSLPRLVVTGASGFIGRHLLAELKERYQIIGLGRRSQYEAGAPVHSNITWYQADIGDRASLAAVFDDIREHGGAELLLHLAAHYDFTGDEHPEYWRTNVEGLRNVLEVSKGLGLRRFIFASSVAASRFPAPGRALTEASIPDGEHIYAVTKRLGEELLKEYRSHFRTCIVRFAALFSDWCEYPPLFMFLGTWLSGAWNARVLGGRGHSAIPYLHVHDAAAFLGNLLEKVDILEPEEVVVASPDGAVSHQKLYDVATALFPGPQRRPIHMPKVLCGPGMLARFLLGRLLGNVPFERPWMARYIDLEMTVDASRTRERLDWSPRPRLEILRRLPFLLTNFRLDVQEWNRLNRAAMKVVQLRPNLLIHRLLEAHDEEIRQEFTDRLIAPDRLGLRRSYQLILPEEHDWNHRLILRHLRNSILTHEKAIFMGYCRDLAERRHEQGFHREEVCYALVRLSEICVRVLEADPAAAPVWEHLDDFVASTIQFGIDQIEDVFDHLEPRRPRLATRRDTASEDSDQDFMQE